MITQYHSEQLWIELFLTVRAFIFVRPVDQAEQFFLPVALFPHNPESKVCLLVYFEYFS